MKPICLQWAEVQDSPLSSGSLVLGLTLASFRTKTLYLDPSRNPGPRDGAAFALSDLAKYVGGLNSPNKCYGPTYVYASTATLGDEESGRV